MEATVGCSTELYLLVAAAGPDRAPVFLTNSRCFDQNFCSLGCKKCGPKSVSNCPKLRQKSSTLSNCRNMFDFQVPDFSKFRRFVHICDYFESILVLKNYKSFGSQHSKTWFSQLRFWGRFLIIGTRFMTQLFCSPRHIIIILSKRNVICNINKKHC